MTAHEPSTVYRLCWEAVHPHGDGARFYYGDHPRPGLDRSTIPEPLWLETCNETPDPWEQFDGLQELIGQGELIRNVRLYTAVVQTSEWTLVGADYGRSA